jgi:hypothetical protein
MDRGALVVALALTLPLAFYGIPYAYAATTTITTYSVQQSSFVPSGSNNAFIVRCLSPSDFSGVYPALSAPIDPQKLYMSAFDPLNSAGTVATDGQTVNGWGVQVSNRDASGANMNVIILCTTAITVAGIGVPQFGSLYVAIALGAVAYFLLSRRLAGRPAIPALAQA